MTHDDNGGGWGTLAGLGILLVELSVFLPGLLACLLLLTAFALPLLVPAVPVVVLGGLFLAIRKLGRAVFRTLTGNHG